MKSSFAEGKLKIYAHSEMAVLFRRSVFCLSNIMYYETVTEQLPEINSDPFNVGTFFLFQKVLHSSENKKKLNQLFQ